MSSSVGQQQLSEERRVILTQFKDKIADCQLKDSSDEYLLKWLAARNYDLDQAEKMLRKSLEWRRVNNVDDILDNYKPPEVIEKFFPMGRCGVDKFGCPVWYSADGRLDMKGIMQSVPRKEITRFNIWMVEKMSAAIQQESERTGKKITQQTTILDMADLNIAQMIYKPAMDVGAEQLQIFDENYPENLRRAFIINTPKIFSIFYNICKLILNKNTIDKIRIYGHDKEEWTRALLEEIDADQLPVYYGGKLTDPDGDPKCPSKFNMGGEVPKEYYMCNSLPVPKEGMETLNIIAGAGGFKKLKIKVEVANSILRWEFMSEGGDIAYRIFYKTETGAMEDFVPLDRVDSHLRFEEGQITCENTGKYTFLFDNTFSFFKPKKVRYLIDVIQPVPNLQSSQ